MGARWRFWVPVFWSVVWCSLCLSTELLTTPTTHGGDVVNVISVENMDALLRLRLAPEADTAGRGRSKGDGRWRSKGEPLRDQDTTAGGGTKSEEAEVAGRNDVARNGTNLQENLRPEAVPNSGSAARNGTGNQEALRPEAVPNSGSAGSNRTNNQETIRPEEVAARSDAARNGTDNQEVLRPVEDASCSNCTKSESLKSGRRSRHVSIALCDQKEWCTCTDATKGYLNIACNFSIYEEVQLKPGSVPINLVELTIDGTWSLTIRPKTFNNLRALNRVVINRVNKQLHVQKGALVDVQTPSFFFEVNHCKSVILEDTSFRNMHGPVSVTIFNCGDLSLGSSVFSWLGSLSIRDVNKLALVENTFSTENNNISKHGSAAKIEFLNVTIDVLPQGTFPSPANEIRFKDCRLKTVSAGAFKGVTISRVSFEETEIGDLPSGTFSDATLMNELVFQECEIKAFNYGVLRAASTLTITRSRIWDLREGAFNNITVARIHLSYNTFNMVRRGGFSVISWNDIIIHGNQFQQLETDAFAFPFHSVDMVFNYNFNFTNNKLKQVGIGGLSFIPENEAVDVHVSGNTFATPCSCILKDWMADRAGSKASTLLFESSLCTVTSQLATCFQLYAGAMSMFNYTEQVCGQQTEIVCEEASRRFYPEDPNVDWGVLLENEKRVFTFIIMTVLCCVCFIIIVVTAMWIKKKGLIGRVISQFFRTSSLVATSSISRVNIHEYAEIQNLRNQTQIIEESDEEEMVPYDDKATQTLPEELTQDLLQSLREKLDDPDNYREARDMIEHLYDLIKVEESCNSVVPTIVEEDTLYAEVRPRTRPRPRDRDTVSVGTRSPSLDKLTPVTYLPRPAVVSEYAEPQDRHVSTHVYCELPGGNVPDVLVSTRLLANRPLPEAPSSSRS